MTLSISLSHAGEPGPHRTKMQSGQVLPIRFERVFTVIRLMLAALLLPALIAGQDLPSTGMAIPGMAPFDNAMLAMLQKYKVPGGSLAVVRDGRLIYARGYGWADSEAKVPVQPDSLFRFSGWILRLRAGEPPFDRRYRAPVDRLGKRFPQGKTFSS